MLQNFSSATIKDKNKAIHFAKKKLKEGYRWAELSKRKGKYIVEYGMSPTMDVGLSISADGINRRIL